MQDYPGRVRLFLEEAGWVELRGCEGLVCEHTGGGKGMALLPVPSGQSQRGASSFHAGFFPLSLGCYL